MTHFSRGVEQALHYLFRLGAKGSPVRPSARDVADFYELSAPVAAKLFTALEKAGIVIASEGREGGYRLARPPTDITVLQVVDAIDGHKRLFECRNIRANCVVFGGRAPDWSTSGVCAIHAVMIEAERSMRAQLASVTLEDIRKTASTNIPAEFGDQGRAWFAARREQRRRSRKNVEAAGAGDA